MFNLYIIRINCLIKFKKKKTTEKVPTKKQNQLKHLSKQYVYDEHASCSSAFTKTFLYMLI